jgi:hypothetical protein
MVDRIIPGSHKLYLGLVKFGLKRAKASTGADIIGFRPDASGGLKPDPMQLQRETGPANAPKYKAKSDSQKFDPGPESVSSEFIGKTPVGFFVEDPPRQTSLLEARVRDAIDLDNYDELYTDANINLTEVILPDNTDPQAIADGGMASVDADNVIQRDVSVQKSVLPDDALIDLSSGSGNGSRVSWRRVNDILHERVSTEEMQMQEERGLIAGKSGEEVKKIMKWALMAIVAVVAILVLGPDAVSYIFGNGGGGGGGGIVPIFMAF